MKHRRRNRILTRCTAIVLLFCISCSLIISPAAMSFNMGEPPPEQSIAQPSDVFTSYEGSVNMASDIQPDQAEDNASEDMSENLTEEVTVRNEAAQSFLAAVNSLRTSVDSGEYIGEGEQLKDAIASILLTSAGLNSEELNLPVVAEALQWLDTVDWQAEVIDESKIDIFLEAVAVLMDDINQGRYIGDPAALNDAIVAVRSMTISFSARELETEEVNCAVERLDNIDLTSAIEVPEDTERMDTFIQAVNALFQEVECGAYTGRFQDLQLEVSKIKMLTDEFSEKEMANEAIQNAITRLDSLDWEAATAESAMPDVDSVQLFLDTADGLLRDISDGKYNERRNDLAAAILNAKALTDGFSPDDMMRDDVLDALRQLDSIDWTSIEDAPETVLSDEVRQFLTGTDALMSSIQQGEYWGKRDELSIRVLQVKGIIDSLTADEMELEEVKAAIYSLDSIDWESAAGTTNSVLPATETDTDSIKIVDEKGNPLEGVEFAFYEKNTVKYQPWNSSFYLPYDYSFVAETNSEGELCLPQHAVNSEYMIKELTSDRFSRDYYTIIYLNGEDEASIDEKIYGRNIEKNNAIIWNQENGWFTPRDVIGSKEDQLNWSINGERYPVTGIINYCWDRTSVTVKEEWNVNGDTDIPEGVIGVVVELYRDGKLLELEDVESRVILSDANNWEYTWELPFVRLYDATEGESTGMDFWFDSYYLAKEVAILYAPTEESRFSRQDRSLDSSCTEILIQDSGYVPSYLGEITEFDAQYRVSNYDDIWAKATPSNNFEFHKLYADNTSDNADEENISLLADGPHSHETRNGIRSYSITITNREAPAPLIKVDQNGNPVEGAAFAFYRLDSVWIDRQTLDMGFYGESVETTTDSSGLLNVPFSVAVSPQNFFIKELSPTGQDLNLTTDYYTITTLKNGEESFKNVQFDKDEFAPDEVIVWNREDGWFVSDEWYPDYGANMNEPTISFTGGKYPISKIINYSEDTTSVTVRKEWNVGGNASVPEGVAGVKVELRKVGGGGAWSEHFSDAGELAEVADNCVVLSESNDWSYTWSNLPLAALTQGAEDAYAYNFSHCYLPKEISIIYENGEEVPIENSGYTPRSSIIPGDFNGQYGYYYNGVLIKHHAVGYFAFDGFENLYLETDTATSIGDIMPLGGFTPNFYYGGLLSYQFVITNEAILKADEEGNPVSGAKFAFYNANNVTVNMDTPNQPYLYLSDDSFEFTIETDILGHLCMPASKMAARYIVVEVSPPDGFKKSSDDHYTIVCLDDGEEILFDAQLNCRKLALTDSFLMWYPNNGWLDGWFVPNGIYVSQNGDYWSPNGRYSSINKIINYHEDTTSVTVKKEWNVNGNTAVPEGVTGIVVELYRDGQLLELENIESRIILSDENNWEYTWRLPFIELKEAREGDWGVPNMVYDSYYLAKETAILRSDGSETPIESSGYIPSFNGKITASSAEYLAFGSPPKWIEAPAKNPSGFEALYSENASFDNNFHSADDIMLLGEGVDNYEFRGGILAYSITITNREAPAPLSKTNQNGEPVEGATFSFHALDSVEIDSDNAFRMEFVGDGTEVVTDLNGNLNIPFSIAVSSKDYFIKEVVPDEINQNFSGDFYTIVSLNNGQESFTNVQFNDSQLNPQEVVVWNRADGWFVVEDWEDQWDVYLNEHFMKFNGDKYPVTKVINYTDTFTANLPETGGSGYAPIVILAITCTSLGIVILFAREYRRKKTVER